MWQVKLTNNAQKDFDIVKKSKYSNKVKTLLEILKQNPFQNPPPYEKLEPPKDNMFSRRINSQHRIVYHVNKAKELITIMSLWTHYE
jgi:Txe/YoeB family toxin of toxin-antitoxin system